jgi:peroxiredoxin
MEKIMKQIFNSTSLSLLILFITVQITLAGEPTVNNNVASSAEEICPLLTGAPVPSVTLTTIDGEPFTLNSAVIKKPAVLIFYRGGWCPFCNLHLAELKNIEDDLLRLGYQILAVSMDRPAKLRESLQKHEMKYTLLSDSAATAARAFGIAFKVEAEYIHKLLDFGMDLEKASGKKHHILPVPAVFIVGTDGVIKFEFINPNYKVRISSELLLEAAKAGLSG